MPDVFHLYLGKIIEFFVSTKMETILPLPTINIVQSMCRIMDVLLISLNRTVEKTKLLVERLFLYASMWAFGGALQTEQRKAVSIFFKSLSKNVKFPDQVNRAGLLHRTCFRQDILWQDT